jgi:hypothetical protein
MNLVYFQTSKELSCRQARWGEILSSYDFVIKHLDGQKNPDNGASRRPDNEIGYKRHTTRRVATLATTTVQPYNDLLQEFEMA